MDLLFTSVWLKVAVLVLIRTQLTAGEFPFPLSTVFILEKFKKKEADVGSEISKGCFRRLI